MRKSTFWTLALLMVSAFFSICLFSCSSDDDDGSGDGTPTSGKWYLVTYDDQTCTHGEYIKFRTGKLDWNNRLNGKNTTYDCSISGNSFYLTNCSDGSKDVSFHIEGFSSNEMVTTSSDGFIRTWKR